MSKNGIIFDSIPRPVAPVAPSTNAAAACVAGAMLVYDISRPDTRDTIAKWKKEIEEKVSLPNGAPLPTILLANKADLKTRELDKLEIDAYVRACVRACQPRAAGSVSAECRALSCCTPTTCLLGTAARGKYVADGNEALALSMAGAAWRGVGASRGASDAIAADSTPSA